MKYCATKACSVFWKMDDENYCEMCGQELTPEIRCLCGRKAYNPKLAVKFCSSCGKAFTPEYIGQCMKAQLTELVQEITSR